MEACPDEKLCEKLGRHVHGRIYELYTTNEKYRRLIEGNGPGIIEKAKNLVVATTKHVRHGLQLVDDITLEQRLNICGKCSELKESGECRLCGCSVQLKAKWASEECPAGKWDAELDKPENRGCACS